MQGVSLAVQVLAQHAIADTRPTVTVWRSRSKDEHLIQMRERNHVCRRVRYVVERMACAERLYPAAMRHYLLYLLDGFRAMPVGGAVGVIARPIGLLFLWLRSIIFVS